MLSELPRCVLEDMDVVMADFRAHPRYVLVPDVDTSTMQLLITCVAL